MKQCDGDRNAVYDLKQCAQLNGNSIATVSARIKETYQKASQTVLDKIQDERFQTLTQVHKVISCSEFDPKNSECTYTAKLSDMIETQAIINIAPLGTKTDVDNLVFWRYRVSSAKNSEWILWYPQHDKSGNPNPTTSDDLTFLNAQTDISIEAWTQCGKVRDFVFSVHLHLHTAVEVCQCFPNMWYQTAHEFNIPKTRDYFCAYPNSDFAELTFDFVPSAGIAYTRDKIERNVAHVACSASIESNPQVEILAKMNPGEIISRFALELIHKGTTRPATNVNLSCIFDYVGYDNDQLQRACWFQYKLQDCTDPTIDAHNGVCQNNKCQSDTIPGPYEACGGRIVTLGQDGLTTKTKTIIINGNGNCCQKCDEPNYTTECKELPGVSELKRCEPQNLPAQPTVKKEGFGEFYDKSYLAIGQNHAQTTVLLGANALVGVVMLVVVKRRRGAFAKPQQAEEDVYYPLLS